MPGAQVTSCRQLVKYTRDLAMNVEWSKMWARQAWDARVDAYDYATNRVRIVNRQLHGYTHYGKIAFFPWVLSNTTR